MQGRIRRKWITWFNIYWTCINDDQMIWYKSNWYETDTKGMTTSTYTRYTARIKEREGKVQSKLNDESKEKYH